MLQLLRKSFLSPQALPPPPPLVFLLQLLPQNPTNNGTYERARTFSSLPLPSPPQPPCPGCGFHLQDSDPSLPGFFRVPAPKKPPPPILLDELFPLNLKSGLLPQLLTQIPTQSQNQIQTQTQIQIQTQNQIQIQTEPEPEPEPVVVCQRCFSLRHYGRPKNHTAEALLPKSDIQAELLPRIASPDGPPTIVLAIVDVSDFDGSFPRKIASTVASIQAEHANAKVEGMPGNVPRLVVVATKIDLLPQKRLSPTGLDYWVRQRARECGAGTLAGVHLVSSLKGWGVQNLLEHLAYLAGPRGKVFAVGAQNSGKSALINAMTRRAGVSPGHLTEAPLPGTTLGFVEVDGVLFENAKLFDMPGILHPYQLSTRLTEEEHRLVHIRRELRPRTYRIKAGHSIHIGGLVRLDAERLSVETIYVTVWASTRLPLHMGKTENACKFVEEHFGRRLQPPIGEKRVGELGKWVRREFYVCGKTWNVNTWDIAAAGLGWFAIGLRGEAILSVWTYDGIDVVLRSSLLPERAKQFDVAGFTTTKILSEAERALSGGKSEQGPKEKKAKERRRASVASSERKPKHRPKEKATERRRRSSSVPDALVTAT